MEGVTATVAIVTEIRAGIPTDGSTLFSVLVLTADLEAKGSGVTTAVIVSVVFCSCPCSAPRFFRGV